MKVAVLMGGNSSERDVSLKTGEAVVLSLKRLGHRVVPCPYEGDVHAVLPFLQEVDVVFNALHGGEGEDGTVQGILEAHGIPYTGSGPEASALAMDKHKTKVLLRENGLPTPPWLHVRTGDPPQVDLSRESFSYPVVVKPNHEGSTVGVTIVRGSHELDDAMAVAGEFGSDILIEQYIPGREITVAILGERSLPLVEIIPSHDLYDYACKYTEGMSRYECPAELPAELAMRISRAAEEIARLLGCRHYCRVDFRLNPGGEFFCLEVNTLPGFTGTSLVPKAAKARGFSFDELVTTILDYAIRRQ
ncbi:MAG: D-alanine--D-alanine ligase [Fidelibacterota bacterium]